MRYALVLFASLAPLACGGTEPPGAAGTAGTAAAAGTAGAGNAGSGGLGAEADILPPPLPGEGFQMAFEIEVPPATEVWKCLVTKLPDSNAFFEINRVHTKHNTAIHHMDVTSLSLTGVSIPHGQYDCNKIYADHPELMEKGIILIAAQAPEYEIRLPAGVSAHVPPGMDIMHEIHYVNTSTKPVKIQSKVNAYFMPDDQVKNNIWGFTVRDRKISIPPGAKTEEWARCTMTDDVDVIFLATHTHKLATRTTLRRFDGHTVGEQVYENLDWHAPKLIDFPTPLHVKKGEGFELRCYYENPGDKTVEWGFSAEDEMCQFAMVFTPGLASADCKWLETSDGDLRNR